jgi:uncharacterized membrane protein
MKLMPNRSLSSEGTVIVFIILAIGLVIPIIPFLGTEIGITLTLFSGLTFYLFLFFLGRSFRSGQLYEEIKISSKKILVIHKDKNKKKLTWEGNPYWTKVIMEDNSDKVENYLTLTERGRHIELGAFLSPDERLDLKNYIQNALAKAKLS